MKKQIVIRVDSGNIIGFGHAMRCLTIANKMKKNAFLLYYIIIFQ